MGKRRPERDQVELALKENPKRKAHEIAKEVGLIDTMGYDKAVEYVKGVKKSLKTKGELPISSSFANDEDRLKDITTLYELRKGNMKHIRLILMLNCYYRLRSRDDCIHMDAIDDTYRKNRQLEEPISMKDAIYLCGIALDRYMRSIDEEKNEAARKRGYPAAGFNYTDERFIEKLEITGDELPMMVSIKHQP